MDIEQNVTANDIAKGHIRCGVAIKRHLPQEKTEVSLVVMGQTLHAKYDPRNGPDRGRSGILSIGRERMESLVGSGRTLKFRISPAGMPTFS